MVFMDSFCYGSNWSNFNSEKLHFMFCQYALHFFKNTGVIFSRATMILSGDIFVNITFANIYLTI